VIEKILRSRDRKREKAELSKGNSFAMNERRGVFREYFLQGTYVSCFRYNGRGRQGRQAADEEDKRADHKSGRHKKKEEFLGAAVTIVTDFVAGDAYADDTQGLSAKEGC